MKAMWTQIKTVIGSLMQRIGSFVGSKAVVVTSYAPMIAAVVFGGGLALMPWLFDLSAWAYWFTIPFGLTAGVLGYFAVFMAMDE
jgi:hypothetical protein